MLFIFIPFNAWCHLEVQTYLNKAAAGLFKYHFVKSVKIRSFFWSVFSRSPNGENTGQKNSIFGHFSRSVCTMFQWTPNVKGLCEHYYWSVLSKEIQKKKTINHPKKLFVVTLSCCVCQWANPQKDNFPFRTCGKMCAGSVQFRV